MKMGLIQELARKHLITARQDLRCLVLLRFGDRHSMADLPNDLDMLAAERAAVLHRQVLLLVASVDVTQRKSSRSLLRR